MKRWLRRIAYLVIVAIWLMVMSFPVLAFSLARKGELHFGSNGRLFLVQGPDVEGVGFEWTRPLRQHPTCSRTTVTYIMWRGQNENTTYCQCFDEYTGAALPKTAQLCNMP